MAITPATGNGMKIDKNVFVKAIDICMEKINKKLKIIKTCLFLEIRRNVKNLTPLG